MKEVISIEEFVRQRQNKVVMKVFEGLRNNLIKIDGSDGDSVKCVDKIIAKLMEIGTEEDE